MAERVRSLLFALKATLHRLGDPKQQQEGGVVSGEHALKGDVLTLVQQLLKLAGRALQDRDVPRDEKLLCASLLLRSDEPPDLLRFLAWGAGVPGGGGQVQGLDAVRKAKQLALQQLYALVKALDHGPGGGLLVGLEARMLHAVWAVYKKEYALSGRSELQYALARLVTLLLKRHPQLLHEPVDPERADLEAHAVPQQQSQASQQQQGEATSLPLYRQAIRILRERRKAGSKLATRVHGQELKLASLVLALLGEEAARQRRRRRRRGHAEEEGGEESGGRVVVVEERYVRDEATLLLQSCHKILAPKQQGEKAAEPPIQAGALGAVDRLLGLTEGPFAGEAGRAFLYDCVFERCLKDFALGNADRYAPAGKALRLVEHHAPFFQRQLTAEARATYDKMHAIYARVSQVKSAASTIDKHALPALEAVLAVLAEHCESKLAPQQTPAAAAAQARKDESTCVESILDSPTLTHITSRQPQAALHPDVQA